MSTRIAVISAVVAAMPPATSALAAEFPAADVWHILDDKLLEDADARGGLTPELAERMAGLIAHAVRGGAEGVLLTCSLYGPVAAQFQPVPVLAPDQAAFDELADAQYREVLVLASFATACDDSVRRLRRFLAERGCATTVGGRPADAAMAATRAGDGAGLVDALADAYGRSTADAVFLAQYSLAPAAAQLASRIGRPVIAGPVSAATRLRRVLDPPRDGSPPASGS